jgi:hypothetical protein
LSALEQSRGCARGCVRRVRSCAADGKALVRHRALLVFRTVRGRSRADPTDPPPRRHNTAGTKRRLKMRSSGPRASTRARRRSARACLGACPRATCAFRCANISFPQTLTTRDDADVSRAFHPPRLARRREFVELKERYESCMLDDEGPLLDVRAPVRAAAASFMSKVADGASASGACGARADRAGRYGVDRERDGEDRLGQAAP